MMRQYELVEKVLAYDPDADEALLNKAYIYGYKKHGTQKRASGDPYFSHPIEVAAILADLKLDATVVATGLLHDTIEDTDATREEIDQLFGEEIGELVEGLTKISKLKFDDKQQANSSNFRKMFFAFSKDIRVLLVKLADRLHNMRTIHHVKEEKAIRISQETMDIYAPLAGRMGMQNFREELEDICFQILNKDARQTILNRLDKMHSEAADLLDNIADTLNQKLKAADIDAYVYGREKRPFSIFRKMERQSISLEKISDIFAFRIITKNENDCYRALGIVHTEWPMVPERFKDFISIPKSNDYRSIHTTIIGPARKRIELQIRTEEMHEVNEHGVASHALYKDTSYTNGPAKSVMPGEDVKDPDKPQGSVPVDESSNAFAWLRRVVESVEERDTNEDFLEHTKLELFADQVFCFTPKGRLIALPKHGTVIDFAYGLHTEIGNMCIGAKINGVSAPLRAELTNGDEVEIITSNGAKPQTQWLSFVKTGKARSAIKRIFRIERRKYDIELGKGLFERTLNNFAIPYDDKRLAAALPKLGYDSLDDLYVALTHEQILIKDVAIAMAPMIVESAHINDLNEQIHFELGADNHNRNLPIVSKKNVNSKIRFSKKYPPILGERIIGIDKGNEGIVIYPINCDGLIEFDDHPEVWIDFDWIEGNDYNQWFTAPIEIKLVNEMGALSKISTVIFEQGSNIWNSYMMSKNHDYHHLYLEIEVRNYHHFNMLLNTLKMLDMIHDIQRVAGKKFGEIEV